VAPIDVDGGGLADWEMPCRDVSISIRNNTIKEEGTMSPACS